MVVSLILSCLSAAVFVPSFASRSRPHGHLAFQHISHGFRTPSAIFNHSNSVDVHDAPDNVALHTVRGGQYFLPAEQLEQRRLQDEWASVSRSYGFSEYSLGVVAHAELFKSTHDINSKEHRNEMYTFTDRKGRRLALRGDVTPQFMAMLRSHREGTSDGNSKFALSPPQVSKWYTMADCWRYERPGHCRRRNHLQWTCDIVGISEVTAEIELLTMLISFFKKYNLSSTDVAIHLSHRQSTTALLELLHKPTDDSQWLYEFRKVMDKYRKVSREELTESLLPLGFTTGDSERLIEMISSCTTIAQLEKVFPHDSKFVDNLRNIFKGLQYAECADWVTIDLSIVRGNDYYTGAVFECFDRHNRNRRAIAGGGRYDNYFGTSSANDLQLSYAVGFGMGNVAIIELLRDRGYTERSTYVDVVVFTPVPDDEDGIGASDLQNLNYMLDEMRRRGLKVYLYYKTPKWQKALEFAEKAGAVTFVYPRVDPANNKLTYQVHDLHSKTKVTMTDDDVDKLIEHIGTAKGRN